MREWLAKRLFEAGNRAMKRSDDTRGIAWYYAALACVPYSPTPLVNLGAAMAREGDYYGALGCVRRAMLMSPNDPLPHWNAALYHLTLGQFDEGWRLYEARFAMPRFSEINGLRGGDMAKMWTHDTYPGKRVLVFNEQGAGDTIMGLRYGPTLKREYGVQRVIYRVPDSMLRLARASGLADEVVTNVEPLPPHDSIVPFMSLLGRCGAPSGKPYLRAQLYGETVERVPGLNVGFVWQGSRHHPGDAKRSLQPNDLEQAFSAFSQRNVSLISYQIDVPIHPLGGFSRIMPMPERPKDYYDTARMLQSLDLLITVDTSIAHLAGALGVPTWIMLPFAADFRWGQHSETTPWYDSVRLFRQTTAGDWSSVIERVQRGLEVLAASRSAA